MQFNKLPCLESDSPAILAVVFMKRGFHTCERGIQPYSLANMAESAVSRKITKVSEIP